MRMQAKKLPIQGISLNNAQSVYIVRTFVNEKSNLTGRGSVTWK